eukprot:GDKJ01056997.1.p1 GENE.GDKJ01056997.1~~GDKJ01056997.1.p1  ORF type:complete len:310 (-),score=54.51 GDKJ01056997.1:233-1162(-)
MPRQVVFENPDGSLNHGVPSGQCRLVDSKLSGINQEYHPLYGNGQTRVSPREMLRAQHGTLLRAMTLLLSLQLAAELSFAVKHFYLADVSVREVASQIRHASPSLLWNIFYVTFICDIVFMVVYFFFGFRAYMATHHPDDFDTFSKIALVGVILESMFAYQSRDSVPNILVVLLRGVHFFIARYLGLIAAALVFYGVSENNIFIMDDDELMQQANAANEATQANVELSNGTYGSTGGASSDAATVPNNNSSALFQGEELIFSNAPSTSIAENQSIINFQQAYNSTSDIASNEVVDGIIVYGRQSTNSQQ